MAESPIFYTPGDEPNLESAAAMARRVYRFFHRELAWERRRIIPGLTLAAVKVTFRDPPEDRTPETLEAEHMWMSDVSFDGRRITATLLNNPDTLKSVREGQTLSVAPKDVCDWMYVVGDEVCGGFTIDAMRAGMSRSQRKAHDAAWGFDFGPVGIVDVVPRSFVGQKPARSGWFGGKPDPQDYAELTQTEHPMSVNMRDSLEEQLQQTPDFLTQTDDRGFNLLHDLALAGSADGVDVCLKAGADPSATTAAGLTALDLARSLGWPKVEQRLR